MTSLAELLPKITTEDYSRAISALDEIGIQTGEPVFCNLSASTIS